MIGFLKHMFNRSSADHVLGINERNLKWVYPLNPRKFFALADDKVVTKQILEDAGVPVAKQLAVISSIGEIEEALGTLGHPSCAMKPSKGKGGGGILVLHGTSNGWLKGDRLISTEEVSRHIANIIFGVFSFGAEDRVLIEEKIEPSKVFLGVYPEGVADLRLIYKKRKLLMGMMRIPTAASEGKANLHQGAIGVGVDLETGRLLEGYDGDQHLKKHPDSKVKFAEVSIPNWEKVLEVADKTARCFPLDYLGIDIAFDETKGPLVLEINVRPGLEIQNVNRKGLKVVDR